MTTYAEILVRLRDNGLTLPLLAVMEAVTLNEGANICAIARILHKTRTTVYMRLHRLKELGYVKSIEPKEGKEVKLYITAEGRAIFKQIGHLFFR